MVLTYHDGHDDVLVDVLRGEERIVSYPATSQFNARGISACGLAAMNFASVLLERLHDYYLQEGALDVLLSVIRRESIEDVISICSGWSSELHLDVEDIQNVPPFDKSLSFVSTRHGVPNAGYFTRTLQYMQTLETSVAVIITRPPETIACAKITTDLGMDIFVIFDSHPRPSYPSGAGIILNTSIDQAVARLTSILPVIDDSLPQDDLQWQAQLLNNVASRVFVSNGPEDVRDVRRSTIASGLAILKLQAEIAELKEENARLTSENKGLERHVEHLEDALSVEKPAVTPLQTSSKKVQGGRPSKSGQSSQSGRPASARFTNPIPGQMWLSHLFNRQKYGQQSQRSPTASSTASSPSTNDDHLANKRKTDEELALELQLQQTLDDMQLNAALAASAASAPTSCDFSCAICMDDHPMDNSVELDCNHPICRDCIRGHICSKIEEHRFPVFCPMCMAEKSDQPGVISRILVELIGIDEKQYAIWEDMELGQHSVLIHCRQCQRSVSVDKEEHEESEVLICPLPDCSYSWCKACQEPITADDPPHSCDGTAELDHLMKEQGWKYCPSCRTPVERDGGCRHMACISPGCNTHFCYACGERIVCSALQTEIQNAVTAHYNGVCQMFDDIAGSDDEDERGPVLAEAGRRPTLVEAGRRPTLVEAEANYD